MKSTSNSSVCRVGAGGVFTDPDNDTRTWFWAHYYTDGEAVLTASATSEAGRERFGSNRICATAKYEGLGYAPWDTTNRQSLTSATFAADIAGFSYLNLNYLFYSASNLTTITGLNNLSGVRTMRYAFSAIGATELDFRGFNPSTLTDLYYCFSSSSSLTTIYVDPSWALPSSGVSGLGCFTSCRALVGGNGTAWSTSNTSYSYFRIDRAGSPGYLAAA